MKTKLLALLLAFGALWGTAGGQPTASAYVDPEGVLRWTGSGREVIQFGVNYTAPFAYSFRAHARLGVSLPDAIDADVYHLARMGLDAYRVHIWDRQISDAQGNVLENEHLEALDYLISKLEQRGFKIILTPLLFGDAGYPETHVPAGGGFSAKYGKQGDLENKESWPLQERYLAQFVSRVNPHTGWALKDDPSVIGFEVCNEPGHFEYAPTLDYINNMSRAIRATGCAKPIFYNMSHGLPVAQAYLDADVQGGTFQWYPSGLVAGHEQLGNFLPYVHEYPIPFADNPKFKTKAKIVYEFDSADIGRSYLYPAMARSFRSAGVQFATQFAYDPLNLAPFNTEYQTHYLNLAYSPQKALSMKIAGEAFRSVPRFKTYGEYPGDDAFEGVRVSYEEDLAEFVTPRKFLYTNNTATKPPSLQDLEEVSGYGSSPVVAYPGRGAYFLDRLVPGVWRLELMPDAIWTNDPFAKASPKKQVCRIAWNEWPMRISLPDLGRDFAVTGLNDGNTFSARANGETIPVRPGTYLLVRSGAATRLTRDDHWSNITLKEFVAPPPSIDHTYLIHSFAAEATAGKDLRIRATVASPEPPRRVTLVAFLPHPPEDEGAGRQSDRRRQPGGGFIPGPGAPESAGARYFPMVGEGFDYSATIPGSQLLPGELRYFIVVDGSGGSVTYPSEFAGVPTDWDFYGPPWEVRVVAPGAPVLLFDAARDGPGLTYQSRERRYRTVVSEQPGSSALQVMARDLDLGEHDESIRYFFKGRVGGRTAELSTARQLVLFGRSATNQPCPVQLALVTSDGIAYGARVVVGRKYARYTVPLGNLAQVRSPNIPHGYPVFIDYWSSTKVKIPFAPSQSESLLISIGPGMPPAELGGDHGIEVERVWVE